MKKNKIIGLLSLGLLTISLASCEISDITEFLIDSTKTETGNVSTQEDETENEEDIVDVKDQIEDEDTKDDSTDEEKDTTTPAIEDDVTSIDNKYQLLALSLYQYEEDYETLYGYQALGNDTRYGKLMQDVYETFYEDAHNFLASDEDYEIYETSSFNYIVIGEYEYTKSKYTDVIASAWITFIEENPLYYFTYTGYTVETEGSGSNTTYKFLFLGGTDYAKAEDRYKANEYVLDMINDFNSEYQALESFDDYSVAKMIHDYICNKIKYAYDNSGNALEEYWAHNILGVAYYSEGVCECYAETYLLLSYLTDLNCLIVLGSSSGGGHVWNYVEVDGIWYGVDATWDDGDTISYNYFLVSTYIMAEAHQVNSNYSYGIDYQVTLPTLSQSSYDTSLDKVSTYKPSYPTIVFPIVYPSRRHM